MLTLIRILDECKPLKVGTAFKQQGKGIAMVMGMKMVRPKLPALLATALDLARKSASAGATNIGGGGGGGGGVGGDGTPSARVTVYVHCWRGGMRSSSVTWQDLADFARHVTGCR